MYVTDAHGFIWFLTGDEKRVRMRERYFYLQIKGTYPLSSHLSCYWKPYTFVKSTKLN